MHIGVFEAKTHFSSLLELVARGEQIVITKRGRPIARLIPMDSNRRTIREAIKAIKEFQSSHVLGLDWKILKDEGRK